jgi:molybdopterin molybdotransferase
VARCSCEGGIGAHALRYTRTMRTPREAIADILGRIRPLASVESVSLRAAAGRCLAQDVHADLDLPPFARSSMDGYALRADELAQAGARLRCIGEARAGEPFSAAVPRACCVAIYTGATLPADCDSVVQVERTRRTGASEDGAELIEFEGAVRAGQHVQRRGEILAQGGLALALPRRLSPADLALLAACGVDPVSVRPRPRVAILTTGDELVPANARPGPGQIREGNTLVLAASAERAGARVVRVGILRDDPAELRTAFAAALAEVDALITTGGVSMGKYDLVGAALEAVGVQPVLHKVAVKPGKPIWFGMCGEVPVFGLPGNPVSSQLGFELFVRPALARLEGAGEGESSERLGLGRWRGPALAPDERQNNLPVRLATAPDGLIDLQPVPYLGSADIRAAAAAQALAVVPAGRGAQPGELLEYRPLGSA